MASNATFIQDEDGDFSDWIEVYNGTDTTIELLSYSLSDDGNQLSKWAFPDTLIEAGQFMLVYASGKNRAEAGAELHTNFSLSAAGEALYLSHDGIPIQIIPEVVLEPNLSFGLFPDGSHTYANFTNPSPGSANNNSTQQALEFSHAGGYFSGSFYLELTTGHSNADIFYTINGGIPDAQSARSEGPLYLDENQISPDNINQIQISPPGHHYPNSQNDVPKAIVIRAAVFGESGNRLSEVFTHTYFIESLGAPSSNLPVVSICGEQHDFFNDSTGIMVPGIHFDPSDPNWTGNYYQRGREWERLVNIEYFENEESRINQLIGMRIHGGNSRRNPQKGLRLYARSSYGIADFGPSLFQDKTLESVKRLVLKPLSSSWSEAGIEDHLTSRMATQLDLDYVASRPVQVYLNGEYWGIYFLQERLDERFIADNYGIDPDCVDMMENWSGLTTAGTSDDFMELYAFIEANDLSDQAHYDYAAENIDIDNFIDYQIFEIFIANYDWPANNMKCWKSECGENKWRWVFFDGDGALINYEFDAFDHALSTSLDFWPSNAKSTLFLRKLLENENFYAKFFTRLEALLQMGLNYTHTSAMHAVIRSEIEADLPLQVRRFKFPGSTNYGFEQIEKVKTFLRNRPCVMQSQTADKFEVYMELPQCIPHPEEGACELTTFPNPSSGEVHLSVHTTRATEAKVQIVDVTGRVVYQSRTTLSPDVFTLNVSDMSGPREGLYIIRITTEGCVYSAKQMFVR